MTQNMAHLVTIQEALENNSRQSESAHKARGLSGVSPTLLAFPAVAEGGVEAAEL